MSQRQDQAARMFPNALVVSNFNPLTDSTTYKSERGTWNVSRAMRDCDAGKHKLWSIDVAPAHTANRLVDCDETKVAALVSVAEFPPLIGVMEDGMIWIIDGHHRLRAAKRRGDDEIACYVIEEPDAARYLILFNGERIAPDGFTFGGLLP